MNLKKYTKEQLIEAVKTSISYREVLIKLNVACFGGNYIVLKKAINKFNLDISHFLGRAANRCKTFAPKRDVQDYLTNKKSIQSYKLKNRLIKDKILPYQCNCCKNTEWLNKPIALELHHKDGDNANNQLENLELLCPNCHAFTDNYRSKNSKA